MLSYDVVQPHLVLCRLQVADLNTSKVTVTQRLHHPQEAVKVWSGLPVDLQDPMQRKQTVPASTCITIVQRYYDQGGIGDCKVCSLTSRIQCSANSPYLQGREQTDSTVRLACEGVQNLEWPAH
jgi:hypothetical protein